MKLSRHFKLGRSQAELDFVDIDPDQDRRLFIDPYAFTQKTDHFSTTCHEALASFFSTAVDHIKAGRTTEGRRLFRELNEPNETCLGLSQGRPSGRGVGVTQGTAIYQKLSTSRAVATGVLADLSEGELFVPGVGVDKVSDLTTNIIRGPLIEYTEAQANLLGIPLTSSPLPPVWDVDQGEWRRQYFKVPVVDGRPILLVPKGCVRFTLAFLSDEYYDDYVVSFLQDEALEGMSSLVRTVKKTGRHWVAKKDIKELNPKDKEWLLKFSQEHPDVWERYRSTRKSIPLANVDLDAQLDEGALARALINELQAVPPGKDDADKFHSTAMACLEFLFYPELQNPKKEWEINEGRKRIDIVFSNAADAGFFSRRLRDQRVGARIVVVECKNYTNDVANPELDQLSGRFNRERGRLGLLLTRSFKDRALFITRCRDTAIDDRGYIISMEDKDIIQLLQSVANKRRDQIDDDLSRRFDELVL